jgi:galactokinase/mevalonate kinase-like predicted kinase
MVCRLGLLALEGVEDRLALAFGGLEFLEVLAVDEKAGDEADEQTREEEESDEHGIKRD